MSSLAALHWFHWWYNQKSSKNRQENDQKDLSKPLEASNSSQNCAVQTPKHSSAIDLVTLRNYSFKFVVE